MSRGLKQRQATAITSACALCSCLLVLKFAADVAVAVPRVLSCGEEHTVVATSKDVLACGCNSTGQLGLGESAPSWCPVLRPIPALHNMTVVQVVCGKAHTMCVTAQSQVRCCSVQRLSGHMVCSWHSRTAFADCRGGVISHRGRMPFLLCARRCLPGVATPVGSLASGTCSRAMYLHWWTHCGRCLWCSWPQATATRWH